MEGLLSALILALVIVPIIRYFVWRNRYTKLSEKLADLEDKFLSLNETVSELRLLLAPAPRESAKVGQIARVERAAEKPHRKARPVEPVAKPESELVAEAPETKQVAETPKIAAKSVAEAKRSEPAPPEPAEAEEAAQIAKVERAAEKPHRKAKPVESVAKPESELVAEAPETYAWRNRVERIFARKPEEPRKSLLLFLKDMFWRLTGGRPEQTADWETIIGRHWLSLVGIVVLVVGIALLTQQTLLYLGPAGKIGTGAAVGLLLIVGGVLLGRMPAYRLLAWTILGGGWAILYFTAYAAYNVEQAQIIRDPVTALACLFLVAAGVIGHSLIYRSQLLTGLAYGLGIFAITISPVSVYSLVASLVLAASLIVLLRVFSWYALSAVGVAGTYLNHWRWLEEASAQLASGSQMAPSEGFWLSSTMLLSYWLVFVIATFVRSPQTRRDRHMHFVINLLNTAGMLGMISWQTWEYQHAQLYYLTAPACVAYIFIAFMNRRMQFRELFLFNATVAIGLYAISLPLAISDHAVISWNWLTLYLTIGAFAALVVGARVDELLLRLEAYFLLALGSFAAWHFNLGSELAQQPPLQWPIVPVVILALSGVDDWLQKVKGRPGINPAASELSWVFAIVAATLLALLIWNLVAIDKAGFAWLLLGLALFKLGLATDRHLMRAQGYLLCAAGIFVIFAINLDLLSTPNPVPLTGVAILKWHAANWMLCAFAAVVLYYLGWQLLHHSERLMTVENSYQYLPSTVATAVLAIVIYQELHWFELAGAWMLLGLILFAAGNRFGIFHLRLQSFALSAIAFLVAVQINIFERLPQGETVSTLAWANVDRTIAAFVALGLASEFAWIRSHGGLVVGRFSENMAGVAASYASTIVFSLLFWKIMGLSSVPGAWIILALFLFIIGLHIGIFHLRLQSYLLAVTSFLVAVRVDIYEYGNALPFAIGSWSFPNWLTASLVAAGLAYQYYRIIQTDIQLLRHKLERQFAGSVSFAVVLLVALILWKEMPSIGVAGAWTMLALLLFEISGKYGLGNFRTHAHLLMAAVFARVLMANYTIVTEAYGVSHRLFTVVPIIAAYYYMRYIGLQRLDAKSEHGQAIVSRLYSYAGAVLLIALMRFELGRDYAVFGWAILLPAYYWLGRRADDFDFRLQSYLIASIAFARSWSTSAYLIGELFGLPERLVMTIPVIVALLLATFLAPPGPIPIVDRKHLLAYVDGAARKFFALLASVLIPILIFYQLDIDYISIGWAIAGLGLLGLGFSTGERMFRLCGLALLFATLGKVVFFDLAGVETIYRIISFIVLGAILLLASLGYTRYRSALERYV